MSKNPPIAGIYIHSHWHIMVLFYETLHHKLVPSLLKEDFQNKKFPQ